MKNLLFLLSFIMIGLFTSCGSDSNSQTIQEQETYEVKLNFSSFDTEVSPMQTRIGQSGTSPIIQQYRIYIYNSQGAKVAEKTEQNVNKTKVDNISFQLPKGNYTAVVVVSNENINSYTSSNTTLSSAYAYNRNSTQTLYNDCYGCYGLDSYFSNTNYWVNDYFYKKEAFSLTQSITLNIVAPRITGRLELHLNDIKVTNQYPAKDYAFVKITLDNFPYGVKFSSNSAYLTPTSSQSIYLSKREWESYSNKPIIFNTMPTSTTNKPKVTFQFSDSWADCFNPNYNTPVISYERVVSGFDIYENKVTKLTGDVFTSAGFGLEINSDFSGTITGEL